MADKWLTPNELAARLGISPNTVRAMLREKHPRHAGEERKRWHIPNEWAKEMEATLPPREIAGEREVVATVVSQKGTCAVGHKVGDKFVVGDTSPAGMCSWAFYAIFPFATVLQFGGSFPWAKDPDKITIACPDPTNPVIFELSVSESKSKREDYISAKEASQRYKLSEARNRQLLRAKRRQRT
jgi:uncharacterized repeat protein (TIGR04076 family)